MNGNVLGGFDLKLTENFRASEFVCKCRLRGADKNNQWCHGIEWVHRELVEKLQVLRDKTGKPITITSGCRCPSYNAHVGGAMGSQHLRGKAADIVVAGMDPREVAKLAIGIGFRGVKAYPTFTHVDTREGAKWHVL